VTDSQEPNAEEGGGKPGEATPEPAAEATPEPAAEATPEPAAEVAVQPPAAPAPQPPAAPAPAIRPRISGPAPATPGLSGAQKGLLIVGLILLIGIQAAILFSRDSNSPATPYMPPPPAATEVAQHTPEPASPATESPAAGTPAPGSPAPSSPEPASPAAGSPQPSSPAAAPASLPAGAATVQATVSDNGLESKDMVAPSRREIYVVVSNTGTSPYSLRVEGVGELAADVAPGGQGSMKIVLGPGTFTVRVPGHEGNPAFVGRITAR